MKNYKRLIAFLLAMLMCISVFSVAVFADDDEDGAAAPAAAEEGEKSGGKVDPNAFTTSTSQALPASYAKVRENANLILYIDYSTGNFAVKNKKDGVNWTSNPLDTDADTLANSETKDVAAAQLCVTFIDAAFSTHSLYSTSSNAKIVTETFGDSQIISYYYDDESTNFKVPLMLTLKEDYLEIELLIDSIEENSDARILSIAVLPVFGAGNPKDNGYALLPDGMGSLMTFNRYYTNVKEYDGAVYSKDPTSSASVSTYTYGVDLTESVRLPVYGLKKNNSAYCAVITQSEANATIVSYCSGKINSYNFVYPVVNLRDSQRRRTALGTNGAGVYYSDELPGNFKMRFYFLAGGDADYIGMAKLYRKYLVNEIGMQALASDAGTPMNVTLIGAYKRTKHFLGIPYTGVDTMTTFSQGTDIIKSLSENGVDNMICNMIGWNRGGLEDAVPTKLNAEGKLGGSSAAKKMLAAADELGVPLAMDVDLVNYYKSSGKYKKYNSTVYGLDRSPVPIFPFVLSLNRVDRNKGAHYLYHPAAMLNVASDFVASASGTGLKSFSFMTAGDDPYAAYNLDNVSTRDKSSETLGEMFKNISEKTEGVLTTGTGNAYVFPYADNIVEAPIYSSRIYTADIEVPFYHIALRGLVRLSGPAYNLSSETEDVLLRSAQFGVGLYAVLSHESSSNLKDTSYNKYYSTEYALLGTDIQAAYKRLKPLYEAVGTSAIKNYQIVSDDLKITTFENGAVVYVNYSEKDITHGGVKIAARDYKVVGGDK